MNQGEAIQVSSARAGEIFQGKAASTIKDLMVENSQLSAVVEQLSTQLQQERAAHQETKLKLGASMQAEGSPPLGTGSPQDS